MTRARTSRASPQDRSASRSTVLPADAGVEKPFNTRSIPAASRLGLGRQPGTALGPDFVGKLLILRGAPVSFVWLFGVVAAACGDDTSPSPPVVADATEAPAFDVFLPGSSADAAAPDADRFDAIDPINSDAAPAARDAASSPIGWVEVTLAPRHALYTRGDVIAVSARVVDRRGAEVRIEDASLEWRVEPPGHAAVEGGTLTFRAEGPGAVVACVGEGPCGRAAFVVDDGPPALELTSPAQGAVIGGAGGATISVQGLVPDASSDSDVVVRVNGLIAGLTDAGRFAIDVPAQFGINRIEVTADDGVRRPPARVVRDVLWGRGFARTRSEGLILPGVFQLRLDQALLDGDGPIDPPDGGGELELSDLAQTLGHLLAATDADALLGEIGAVGGGDFELLFEGVRVGRPEIDLALVDGGFGLFVRLPDVAFETAGSLDFQGEQVDLGGTIRVSVATFVDIALVAGDGVELTALAGPIGVAVERVTGEMDDATAQALLATLGSELRDALEMSVVDAVEALVGDRVAGMAASTLNGMLSELSRLPVRVNPRLEGVEPVRFDLMVTPAALDIGRRDGLALLLDAAIVHAAPVEAMPGDPGVVRWGDVDPGAVDGTTAGDPRVIRLLDAPLAAAVHLDLLNAVLHEIWRGGLLSATPPLPDGVDALRGVSIDAPLPPIIVPRQIRDAYPLELQIGALEIRLVGARSEVPDLHRLGLRVGVALDLEDAALRLVVSPDPEFDVQLESLGGETAVIGPAAVAALIEALFWPQVVESIRNGLVLPLAAADVDLESLAEFAPRVRQLVIEPTFDAGARIVDGWILLPGRLSNRLTLGP